MLTEKEIEDILYEKMCHGCMREYYCHNTCEPCDDYEEEFWKMMEDGNI